MRPRGSGHGKEASTHMSAWQPARGVGGVSCQDMEGSQICDKSHKDSRKC